MDSRVRFLSLCALAGLGLTGCYSLPPLPSDVPPGVTSAEVQALLGQPQHIIAKAGPAAIPVVWQYRDTWHRKPQPAPTYAWTGATMTPWASWDVYFDANDHFTGWRIAEPAPPLEASREVRWDLTKTTTTRTTTTPRYYK